MKNKKKKILIVGGTGFIGYHLAKCCLKKKWDVTSLSTKRPKRLRRLNKVSYKLCDISNFKKLNTLLSNTKYNYVVNLGGYVDHKNKTQVILSHFKGVRNLYKIFKNKKIEKFIQIGSSSEYGNVKSPQKESLMLKPKSFYGKAKLSSSKYLIKQFKDNKFPVCVLRFYQLFGPYQENNRFIPQLINSCIRKKKFNTSNGQQLRNFLYIDDGINAILKSIKTKKSIGEIINIGSTKSIKIKKIMILVKNKVRYFDPVYGKIKLRKDEPKIIYPLLSQMKKILSFKPKVNFEVGLNRTILFYKRKLSNLNT